MKRQMGEWGKRMHGGMGSWRLRQKQASVQSHLASQWLCVNLESDPLPVPHYPVGLGRPSSLSASVCQVSYMTFTRFPQELNIGKISISDVDVARIMICNGGECPPPPHLPAWKQRLAVPQCPP